MARMTLVSGGTVYEGFKRVRVEKSITSLAGVFSLEMAERQGTGNYLIPMGHLIEIRASDELLMKGYIEARAVRQDHQRRALQVSGRDIICDLIDCTPLKTDFNAGMAFTEMARVITQDYGLGVKSLSQKKMFLKKDVKLNPSQSCFEALEAQARHFGVLLLSDSRGNVVISDAGVTRSETQLSSGESGNIKSIDMRTDVSRIFSEYQVLGQGLSVSEDFGALSNEEEGLAKDELLSRQRKIVILSDKNSSREDLQKRAEWEATVRRARSRKIRVTVPTWFKSENKLWSPNETIRVFAPSFYLDEQTKAEFLITRCVYEMDPSGSTTSLELVSKDSYQPKPLVSNQEDELF